MLERVLSVFVTSCLFGVILFVAPTAQAVTLAQRLSGRILLQVESRGEAWYVNPVDGNRYYMRDGQAAYDILRTFGLGISNKDFTSLSSGAPSLVSRLKGRIVLRVESHGEAYYVNPVDGKLKYLKDGETAYQIMRSLSLGITNANLGMIPSKSIATVPVSDNASSSQPQSDRGVAPISGGDSFRPKLMSMSSVETIGSSESWQARAGMVHRVMDGLNVRVDEVTPGYVIFSLHEVSASSCKLIASNYSTVLYAQDMRRSWYALPGRRLIELTAIHGDQADLVISSGAPAYQRCLALNSARTEACAIFENEGTRYIQKGKTRMYFVGLSRQLEAEVNLDIVNGCYAQYERVFPALRSIVPFEGRYQVFQTNLGLSGMVTGPSGIQFSSAFGGSQGDIDGMIQKERLNVDDQTCREKDRSIAHELAHAIFQSTRLNGQEWDGNHVAGNPGVEDLTEGFADFLAYYSRKDRTDSAWVDADRYYLALCGNGAFNEVRAPMLFHYTFSTIGQSEAQRSYKNSLLGSGPDIQNSYAAGFCFYKKLADRCGDATITHLVDSALAHRGEYGFVGSLFAWVTATCPRATVESLMNEFGFNLSLLEVKVRTSPTASLVANVCK